MALLSKKLALGPFWWRSRPSAPGTCFSLTRAGGTPMNIILQSILGNSKKSPEFEIEIQCSQLSCVNSVGSTHLSQLNSNFQIILQSKLQECKVLPGNPQNTRRGYRGFGIPVTSGMSRSMKLRRSLGVRLKGSAPKRHFPRPRCPRASKFGDQY